MNVPPFLYELRQDYWRNAFQLARASQLNVDGVYNPCTDMDSVCMYCGAPI